MSISLFDYSHNCAMQNGYWSKKRKQETENQHLTRSQYQTYCTIQICVAGVEVNC